MKQHTGDGLGGVLGLVVWILSASVSAFLIPSEVGNMYKQAGRMPPVQRLDRASGCSRSGPIITAFVWFVKIQGALNRYWEEQRPAPATAAARTSPA